jgi:hypothetical protein
MLLLRIAFTLLLAASLFMWFKTRNKAWAIPTATIVALMFALSFNTPWFIYLAIIALGVIATWALMKRQIDAAHGRKYNKKPFILAAVLVVIVACVGLLIPLAGSSNNESGPRTDKDVVTTLRVTKLTSTCDKVDKFTIPATKPVSEDGRLKSDAIQTPFKSTTNKIKTTADVYAAMVAEVYAAVCKDPLYGATIANLFANLDPRIVAANTWLAPFKGTDKGTINGAAAKYLEHQARKHPTPDNLAEIERLKTEWSIKASGINTLLDKFGGAIVLTGKPILSYHLLGESGLQNTGLPAVGIRSTEQTQEVVRLTLTQSGGKCLTAISFSPIDKSPGLYPCPVA